MNSGYENYSAIKFIYENVLLT